MSTVKRLLSIVLSVCVVFLLSSCNKSNNKKFLNSDKKDINIAFLKGPTGLGALKLIDDSKNGNTASNYNISVLTDPNQIVAQISNGEVDIAALPTNLAATLYNKSGMLKIVAINTLGTLYIVSDKDEDINSVYDLKGKTIYTTGQGSTPEYVLNFILDSNNIYRQKDVDIEYRTEHTELASLVISGKSKLAMLPEPFVTQVINKNSNIVRSIDLTKEWEKSANNNSTLAMGCLVARNDFIDENKGAIDTFLNEYSESVNYINNNVEKASELSEKYEIMPKDIARDAIPKCNIVYIDGPEMSLMTNGFLEVLFDFDPKSIGGRLPNEDFYYKKQ